MTCSKRARLERDHSGEYWSNVGNKWWSAVKHISVRWRRAEGFESHWGLESTWLGDEIKVKNEWKGCIQNASRGFWFRLLCGWSEVCWVTKPKRSSAALTTYYYYFFWALITLQSSINLLIAYFLPLHLECQLYESIDPPFHIQCCAPVPRIVCMFKKHLSVNKWTNEWMNRRIVSIDRGAIIRLWKKREYLICESEDREEGALSITESSWSSWPSEWSFLALTRLEMNHPEKEKQGLSIGWEKLGKAKMRLQRMNRGCSKSWWGESGANVPWDKICLNFHVPGVGQERLYWIRSLGCSWSLNTLNSSGLEVALFPNSSSSAEVLSLDLLLSQPTSSTLSLRPWRPEIFPLPAPQWVETSFNFSKISLSMPIVSGALIWWFVSIWLTTTFCPRQLDGPCVTQ